MAMGIHYAQRNGLQLLDSLQENVETKLVVRHRLDGNRYWLLPRYSQCYIVALAAGFGISKKNESDTTNNNINDLSSAGYNTDGGEVVSSSMLAALGDSPTSAPTPRGTVKSVSNDFALVEGEDSDDDDN